MFLSPPHTHTSSVYNDITGALHALRCLNVRKFPKFRRTNRRNSVITVTQGYEMPAVTHWFVHVVKPNCCSFSVLSQVSTGGRHSKKTQSLLSCNRKVLNMAENTPAIHLQFTEYYFPHSAGGPGTSDIQLLFYYFLLFLFLRHNTEI